jgi:D-alanine-D-alanine ligase
MRIAVLHNALGDRPSQDEQDNLVQLEAVSSALAQLGHEPVALSCSLDLGGVAQKLTEAAPELVFNLVESIDGAGRLIHLAPALLERLGLPLTGAGLDAIFLTSNKLQAKSIMARRGVPVPAWVTADDLRAGFPYPSGRLIVKSVWEHASIGLDSASLIEPRNADELLQELEDRRVELGGSCFAEVYIDGREFNMSVLQGPRSFEVLPPAEMRFEGFPPDMPRMVGYRAKWDEGSFEYAHTARTFEVAHADEALLGALKALSLRCCSIFGLKGFARVDFRVDQAGQPFVLEVNANPCVSPDAGFPAAAAQAGLSYLEMIEAIVEAAIGPHPVALAAPTPAGDGYREHLLPWDRSNIEALVRATGFFSEAEVEVSLELIDAALDQGIVSGYRFLLDGAPQEVRGFTCYGPVPATVESWDIYWIAVAPAVQRQHLGQSLLVATERRIADLGGRRISVETSGREIYRPTRSFYEANDYVRVAQLRDFYAPGDDKVIYLKELPR